MSEQIRGVIIEGLSCSGKTSLFNALKVQHSLQSNNERNTIFLAENYSQNLNLINGQYAALSYEENLRVLRERLAMLETLNNYANSMGLHSRRARGLFYAFERFHLNFASSFDCTGMPEYIDTEHRLLELNALTVLCYISDSKIEERLRHRASFTGNIITEDAISEYKHKQARLIEIANISLVPTLLLNTDTMDWDSLATIVLEHI